MKAKERKEFNICLCGDTLVGKTCMASYFIENQSDEFSSKKKWEAIAKFDGIYYKYKILDTYGKERFRSIDIRIVSSCEGFLLVYDVRNRNSFNNLVNWIEYIKENCDLNKKEFILVGNKNDTDEYQRYVTFEEGLSFAKLKNLMYFETSSKTGNGIIEVFQTLFEKVYQKYNKIEDLRKHVNNSLNINKRKEELLINDNLNKFICF